MVEFSYDEGAGTLRCLLRGRMDGATSPQAEAAVQAELTRLADAGTTPAAVVLDLAGIDYVSSAFLRVVLAQARQVGGGKLRVENCVPFVRKIFADTGIDGAISVS